MIKKHLSLDNYLQEDNLSLVTALWSGLIITLVIGVGVLVAMMANQRRQDEVATRYTQETQTYINRHSDLIGELFTVAFDQCQGEFNSRQQLSTGLSIIECRAAKDYLDALELNELTNSSATAFLRIKDERVELIEASGNYRRSSLVRDASYLNYQHRDQLSDYLLTGKPMPLWGNYINYLPQKEVVTPVKIQNQVVGYIFRSVIER